MKLVDNFLLCCGFASALSANATSDNAVVARASVVNRELSRRAATRAHETTL